MDSTETLSARVAEEIRAMLGRKRVTGRELARRLDVSQPWVSYRLTGHKEIGLDDLERIAQALDVEITDLLPAPARRDSGGGPSIISPCSTPDDHATPTSPGRPPLRVVCATHSPTTDDDGTAPTGHTVRTSRRPVVQPWTHAGVTS